MLIQIFFFQFLHVFIWDAPVAAALKRQISDLKQELGSVNMAHEFAKYSKIKRKLTKATDELQTKSQMTKAY